MSSTVVVSLPEGSSRCSSISSSLLPDDEDVHVQRLSESGALQQIVGSQSILSQELLPADSSQNDNDTEAVVIDEQSSKATKEPEAAATTQVATTSTIAKSPSQAAHRYGLVLSQEVHDPDIYDKDNEQQNALAAAITSQSSDELLNDNADVCGVVLGSDELQLEQTSRVKNDDDMTANMTALLSSSTPLSLSQYDSIIGSKENSQQDIIVTTGSTTCATGAFRQPHPDPGYAFGMQSQESFLSQETLKLANTANFGSLLDAIQLVNEQENSHTGTQLSLSQSSWQPPMPTVKLPKARTVTKNSSTRKSPRMRRHPLLESPSPDGKRRRVTLSPAAAVMTTTGRSFHPNHTPTTGLSSSQTTRHHHPRPKSTTELPSPNRTMAQQAAALAERTVKEPDLQKRLLLSMAVGRTNPRSAPQKVPGPGHVLKDGFFWAHYPPLEAVLKQHMEEYYLLSSKRCQLHQEQQCFNNRLCDLIGQAAATLGWSFEQPHFSDKVLRDRIRCYYKTHIQNAKKRLHTMLKNPSKRANAVHLVQHYQLIQSTLLLQQQQQQSQQSLAAMPQPSQQLYHHAPYPVRSSRGYET